jgi:hypothetical protein
MTYEKSESRVVKVIMEASNEVIDTIEFELLEEVYISCQYESVLLLHHYSVRRAWNPLATPVWCIGKAVIDSNVRKGVDQSNKIKKSAAMRRRGG